MTNYALKGVVIGYGHATHLNSGASMISVEWPKAYSPIFPATNYPHRLVVAGQGFQQHLSVCASVCLSHDVSKPLQLGLPTLT